ncbi:hypothetical protein sS8_1398 [Methylocaldum marinum]|uniref:Methyltransferase type 11 domain-containing protein n=2 Tax=Methylocaldum marinum TaxID=1432792 RepID=A0A250KP38_9GAMM|nr:hypothetical protein sS8_1398 [Methylocaldum marinum]
MLEFVTKAEYWAAEDSGVLSRLPKAPFAWHLKSIQDAVAFTYLQDIVGGRIAEVGGGNSRILPALAADNDCYNIDRFDGQHGGPADVPNLMGVKNVIGYVTDPSVTETIRECDAAFSVSVVEHVPTTDLPDFFEACAKLLRPGGRMVHLIDVYLTDRPQEQSGLVERINHYASVFQLGLLEPWTPEAKIISTGEDLSFSCPYATNPDNIMAGWNRIAPALRDLRAVAQSCTLKLVGTKPK